MKKHLKIGEVCAQCLVTPRTVRYYEEYGLITPATDADTPQKRYPASCITRIKSIKLLQELGYALGDIKKVMALAGGTRTADKWLTSRLRSELRNQQALLQDKIALLKGDLDSVSSLLAATDGCDTCGSKDCAACGRLARLRTLAAETSA